ncbi:TPA: hypothetical protein DDW35_00240, partial [Candidatus Sumerlaeota bacterium]|nr:hypothetical protein [Candidatus Sumerlaeota bacterium]
SNQTALDLRYRAEVKKIIPDNSYVNLAPETVDQLVALSQRAATEWKVEALSRETFSNLKKRYPEQPSVIAAQKAMADIILTSASNAQHELDYDKAMKLSTECLREYGSIPGVKDRAEQIYNLSKVEAEKRAVVTAGNAKQLKEDGDVARQEGIASAQLIARTDRDKNVTAVNPAADALSAFKRAQEKYQKALAAVGNDAELKADINKMLVDVQARMNNLTGQAKKFYK